MLNTYVVRNKAIFRFVWNQQSLQHRFNHFPSPKFFCFSSTSDKNFDKNVDIKNNGKLYLHIGPSGDCWTGSSIFAAKHLQPDYVKSIELPTDLMHNDDMVSTLIELVDEDPTLQKEIYDTGTLPESLLEQLSSDR